MGVGRPRGGVLSGDAEVGVSVCVVCMWVWLVGVYLRAPPPGLGLSSRYQLDPDHPARWCAS